MAARKWQTGGDAVITLTRLQDASVTLDIEGITPVIPHQWSEKARRQMPGWVPMEPEGERPGIEPRKGDRTPREDAEACVYRLPDGRPGIPATAFKGAMVSACRFFEKPSMTEAKLLIHVRGEGPEQLVPFEHDGEPILREDTPRNANGGVDLRYRYAFFPWRATVTVNFIATSIDENSVTSLLDAAGRCGVGDWRPSAPKSATGTFGQWRVVEDSDDAARLATVVHTAVRAEPTGAGEGA